MNPLPDELTMRRVLLLWLLFFLICFGLGYPILNRYDPGKVPGTSDAAYYAAAVRAPLSFSYRAFVPALAKPFYLLGRGRIGTWDPALFGMLVSSSILTASTAITLIAIGLRWSFSYSTCLVGTMLFLCNFAVANWNLSGYVDSGEAFFLTLTTWCLLSNRWFLLPLWAVPGSLSKDTFAPFSVTFVMIWWLRDRPLRAGRIVWIIALGVLSGITVLTSLEAPNGMVAGGVRYAQEMKVFSRVGFLRAVLRCLTAREFWFTFAWLLPLGLTRIRQIDQRWRWAVTGTFLLALLLGGYNDALGNTTRAFFNIAGPLLSLAAADFLTSRGSEASQQASP